MPLCRLFSWLLKTLWPEKDDHPRRFPFIIMCYFACMNGDFPDFDGTESSFKAENAVEFSFRYGNDGFSNQNQLELT